MADEETIRHADCGRVIPHLCLLPKQPNAQPIPLQPQDGSHVHD